MGRAFMRVSTSKPDPESLEQAGTAARRYELTPLFWGFVSLVGLALLGTLVGLGAVLVSGQARFAVAVDKFAAALDVPGVCQQETTNPWRGFILNKGWIPVPGEGRLTATEATNEVSTKIIAYLANRRLSEAVLPSPSFCSATSADECNRETLAPYRALVTGIYLSGPQRNDKAPHCEEPSVYANVLPADLWAQLCTSIYMNPLDNPCFDSGTPDCLPFVQAVELLRLEYPYPCHWDPTDSLGKMLSRYFSRTDGVGFF